MNPLSPNLLERVQASPDDRALMADMLALVSEQECRCQPANGDYAAHECRRCCLLDNADPTLTYPRRNHQ